jgi:Uma2 family endonuclease
MEVKEPAIAYSKRKYSLEEYFEMENSTAEKHEYYQGEVFAMSGAKLPHNDICENLFFHLRLKLKGKPCKPKNSDTRIHVEKNTLVTYPDVSVTCGDRITLNNDNINVLNPVIIFEVLSDSTRKYDEEAKFKLYQDIPTLKEYVMVESETTGIRAWHKNEQGIWEPEAYTNIDQTLYLPAIRVSLELKEIYEGVIMVE